MSFFYQRTYSTPCPAELIDAINSEPTIGHQLQQIINLGDGDVIFDFITELSAGQETAFDSFISAFVCPSDGDPTTDDIVPIDDTTTGENLWTSQQVVDYIDSLISSTNNETALGRTFTIGFAHSSSSVGNAWLRQESQDSGASSDVVPAVMPFPCKLIAATYANASRNTDCDVQLWSSAVGADPNVNKVKFHEFLIRNDRTAVETDFGASDIHFARGERIAVYLRDRGGNSNHPVVELTFLITDGTTANITDTFSNSFSYSSGGDDDDD